MGSIISVTVVPIEGASKYACDAARNIVQQTCIETSVYVDYEPMTREQTMILQQAQDHFEKEVASCHPDIAEQLEVTTQSREEDE